MDISFIIFIGITIFFIYTLSGLIKPREPIHILERFENPDKAKETQKELEIMLSDISKLLENKSENKIPESDLQIPMPKFENTLPNKENFASSKKKPQQRPVERTKTVREKNKETNENVKRAIPYQDICKMNPSASTDEKLRCPSDYPTYLGATISYPGASLCGPATDFTVAEAVGFLRDGKLVEIKVLNGGDNYNEVPKVSIVGDGRITATATAEIKDEKVVNIKITNQGKGYVSTPKIIIEKSKKPINCNLCCKHEI